jgi:site-specific recombinase XerD
MRGRKLHLGHFAFMRAVVQGVDPRTSWERYLRREGEHDDARNVKRTIEWIRDEFAAAARRQGRHGVARLVLIDVRKIPEHEAALPSLEAFATERGLSDCSQAEQLEFYREQFGSLAERQDRRARLIEKQLSALFWLEQLVASPPRADDAIGSWLNPDIARHLEVAGLATLQQLVDRINGVGKTWWRSVQAIGAAKAERILAWIATHERTLGLAIGRHVAVPRSQLPGRDLDRLVAKATAVVPLEKFLVPSALDGAAGAYRAPRHLCLIAAKNDYEAILTWIKSKHGLSPEKKRALQERRGIDPALAQIGLEWLAYLSHTQRAYLKEAERFLLWVILEKQKPLSSMTLNDCNDYREFLANPAPQDKWCAPRSRNRWSVLWRPFEGPLAPGPQRYALTVLRSLYKFLVDQCYLIGNPWNGVTVPRGSAARMNAGRSFTQAQWEFIEGRLAVLPKSSANVRLTFVLHLLYATGVRLEEVVSARVDDLSWVTYPAQCEEEAVEGWLLRVVGKGNKARQVPVPIEVVHELGRYLLSRGLDLDPEAVANTGAFLLGKAIDVQTTAPWSPSAREDLDPKAGIAAGTLYDQIKGFFYRLCGRAGQNGRQGLCQV